MARDSSGAVQFTAWASDFQMGCLRTKAYIQDNGLSLLKHVCRRLLGSTQETVCCGTVEVT